MPRRPRLHVPGGLYHIILRGNARQDIFFSPPDQELWEELLAEGLSRHGHRVHAYCWMTNHVHMAIQAHRAPLSRFVATLASRYARALNKKLQRSGHLFERRYRSTLVQVDSYLLELIRYIHLNPVRAAIVTDPADYRWTSHRAYLGDRAPAWLTTGWVLSILGNSKVSARRAYAQLVPGHDWESTGEDFRAAQLQDDRVLGDDNFHRAVERHEEATPPAATVDEIVARVCSQYGTTEDELAAPTRTRHAARVRAEIALQAQALGAGTVAEIARRFNRSQAALSHSMARSRRKKGGR